MGFFPPCITLFNDNVAFLAWLRPVTPWTREVAAAKIANTLFIAKFSFQASARIIAVFFLEQNVLRAPSRRHLPRYRP